MESHLRQVRGITSLLLIIFQEEGLNLKDKKIIKYKLSFSTSKQKLNPLTQGLLQIHLITYV